MTSRLFNNRTPTPVKRNPSPLDSLPPKPQRRGDELTRLPSLGKGSNNGVTVNSISTPNRRTPSLANIMEDDDICGNSISFLSMSLPPQPQQQQQQQSASITTPTRNNDFRFPTPSNLRSPTPVKAKPKATVCPNKLAEIRSKPKNLSPFDSTQFYPMLPAPLPTKKDKVLLALDLDETLVHATIFNPQSPSKKVPISPAKTSERYDFTIRLGRAGDFDEEHIFVKFRPYMQEFLREVSELFEVAIFTASQSCYADPLLQAMDPDRKIMGNLRLYREHCADVDGSKVKDLSLLGRPLSRVVLVDNAPVSYLFQPRNGIPITSWFNDSNDTALRDLLPLLRKLAQSTDVVEVLDHHKATIDA